jgi:hypothetical protein
MLVSDYGDIISKLDGVVNNIVFDSHITNRYNQDKFVFLFRSIINHNTTSRNLEQLRCYYSNSSSCYFTSTKCNCLNSEETTLGVLDGIDDQSVHDEISVVASNYGYILPGVFHPVNQFLNFLYVHHDSKV